MDRKKEYMDLLEEIENHTPPALEYTFTRAEAKLKKQKQKRLWKIPITSVFACFAAFVMLVNTSTAFASACMEIPLLKELAQAVAFSPSLSAAVDSQYVQPIGTQKTQNGITMRIEHVIVDQRQLNIFYTLKSDTHSKLSTSPWLKDEHMQEMHGFSIGTNEYNVEEDEFRQYTIDFFENKMPSSINLIAQVYEQDGTIKQEVSVQDSLLSEDDYEEPQYSTEFNFKLDFDPSFSEQGKIIDLNKEFTLDGQKLLLKKAEIFPTHMRLVFDDVDSNTAWLKSLEFYIENEKHKKFDKISNGITASGKLDSPMMATHMLDSPFFANSKHLTLNITGASWLEKNMEKIKINLKNQTAEKLPQGVDIHSFKRNGNSWILEFEAESPKENYFMDIFSREYYDEQGNEYSYSNTSCYGFTSNTGKDGTCETDPNKFIVEFALINYPYDIVYLKPQFSQINSLDEPVEITIK